ncbi:MOSC domain-containing protein [archaeon]|nr:MAG: MOSC domain-containing protein [archaeon]
MIRQVHAGDDNKTGLDTQNIYVENFRPNLVIHPMSQPSHAHIEDHYGAFKLTVYCPPHTHTGHTFTHAHAHAHTMTLSSTGPCARCMMVNINHTHGTLENTIVYDVLQAYRKQEGNSVFFGQFLTYSGDRDGDSKMRDEYGNGYGHGGRGEGEGHGKGDGDSENDVVQKALHSNNIWLLPRLMPKGDVGGINYK